MAKTGNDSATQLKKATSWTTLHLTLFTLLGALTATLLTPYTASIPGYLHAPYAAGNSALDTPANPKVRIISFDPFIAHISDFVSKDEREYLLKLG